MNTQHIIKNFIAGNYKQIICPKCEFTFLTNVYDYSDTHVLLEKRSLGLEYYCGAIRSKNLVKVPKIARVGILDEQDNSATPPSNQEVYSGDETDLRFIYIMEKLLHLNDDDTEYFNRHVKELEWKNEHERKDVLRKISNRYNPQLAEDIAKLYQYYTKHKNVIAWDLHGDNLMQRINTDEIVILDPYTRRA
jgi:hypothetical protein